MTEFANHRDFLVSQKACDLVVRIPKELPDLRWYDERADLVLKIAGNRGGQALKVRQHERKEYHETKIKDLIPCIAARVKARLQEMDDGRG